MSQQHLPLSRQLVSTLISRLICGIQGKNFNRCEHYEDILADATEEAKDFLDSVDSNIIRQLDYYYVNGYVEPVKHPNGIKLVTMNFALQAAASKNGEIYFTDGARFFRVKSESCNVDTVICNWGGFVFHAKS